MLRLTYGDALAADVREEGAVSVFGSNGIVGSHRSANMTSPAIVVGRKGSFGKVTFAPAGGFCIDTAFFVDARSAACDLRWAYWTLQTLRLDEVSEDTGVPGLSREHAHNMPVTLPPREFQAIVASFLDRETARTDALIEQKTRFIELLREKRQAVIAHAVSAGVDAAGGTRDSGDAWLGRVPDHWRVTKVKRIVKSMEQGWSPECEARVPEPDEWGVLKVGCVNGGVFRPEESKALPESLTPRPELGLRQGDVLISRANTRELVGSCAVVPRDYPRLMLCDKLYRVEPTDAVSPDFLAILIAVHGRRAVEVEATGASASMVNVTQEVVMNLPIALPPRPEQMHILKVVEKRIEGLRRLIDATKSGLALLAERRAALITAAVTGQIDLRAAAPIEEPEPA